MTKLIVAIRDFANAASNLKNGDWCSRHGISCDFPWCHVLMYSQQLRIKSAITTFLCLKLNERELQVINGKKCDQLVVAHLWMAEPLFS